MKHILVVDADQAIAHMLGVILQRDGHRVISVTSGEAALSALGCSQFDVVLADSHWLCLEVRRDWPTAKVIFTTRSMALRTSRETGAGGRLWADEVLLKPYHLVELRRAVEAPARRRTGHPARRGTAMRGPAARYPAMGRQGCRGRPA